jgi:succinate dehydrogenase / fumarate reductase cytochrome b subunit
VPEQPADGTGVRKNSNPASQKHMTSRPKYLNLLQIRMPVPAFVSIMHRVSGAALFLALPLLLYGWQASLASADSFAAFQKFVSLWFMKVFLLAVLWGYLHHLCAGIRHLAMDIDLGTELASAKLASNLVLAVSIGVTVVTGVFLW